MMAMVASKSSLNYSCTKCGAQYPRWTGRCAECGSWSTVMEDAAPDNARPTRASEARAGSSIPFRSIASDASSPKLSLFEANLDLVLQGGLVPGSVTLLAGEPGIGKSTLLAQAALASANAGKFVMYVTGEESPGQIILRLKRLSKTLPESLRFLDATDAGTVAATIQSEKPDLTIVDSIQSMLVSGLSGEPGNVTQVKASAAVIAEAAKHSGSPVILAGQMTKDGDIAGPRLLEHLVDTVLLLEGDDQHRFRLLRALKHRFGPTDEVAVLAMTESGLESVADPSAELLRERPLETTGTIVTCLIEGHRPLLLEIQALVTPAGYGTPVRRSTGIDTSRLGLLTAVLSRRAGIKVLDKDIYANAAGGIRAREPAADLALCLAIASATGDVGIDRNTVAFGEVGLGGEIRPVSLPDIRLRECERHGFTRAIIPKGSKVQSLDRLEIIPVANLREAIDRSLIASA